VVPAAPRKRSRYGLSTTTCPFSLATIQSSTSDRSMR
jgi:hypothetical protein